MNGKAADTPGIGGRAAWIALLLVSLTQAVSMIDRQILAILAPRIREDLQIGAAELGLLYGTVFGVFYALFSLPLGRLADGWNRTRMLSIAILAWSAMTGLAGFAQSFALLAVTRLGVGVGEATVSPAGMSLLSDVFPRRSRGLVAGVMGAAIALGLGGAMWLGGTIADGWDGAYRGGAAPLGLAGWQAAFLVAAIPGLLLGLAMLFLPEPRRGAADGIAPLPDPHVFRESGSVLVQVLPGLAWLHFARVRAPLGTWLVNLAALALIAAAAVALTDFTNSLRAVNPVAVRIGSLELGGNALQWSIAGFGSYVLVCWAQALRLRDRCAHAILLKTPALNAMVTLAVLQTAINYGLMGWTASYLVVHFNQSLAAVGLTFGLLSAGIGILGPLVSGPLSDFARARHPSGRLFILLGSLGLSPLAAIMVFSADSITGFYLLFISLSFIVTMWMPPLYASLMDLVLPRMRGTLMAYYVMITTIVGLGTGPYAVGLMSDIGGNIGGAILNLFWLSPLIVLATLYAIHRLPRDEASLLDRARAQGEIL